MNSTYAAAQHRHVFDDPDPSEIIFRRLTEERDGTLRAEVIIRSELPPAGTLLGPAKLNLLASRSIRTMANEAGLRQPIGDWYAWLSEACAATVEHWRSGFPLRVLDTAIDSPRRWLLEPWLESDGTTVVFAEGGAGKGWLALAIAAAISTGVPILGHVPPITGPVAYLDWEASYEQTSARLARIAPEAEILYRRETASLDSAAVETAQRLSESGAIAVIIDSKGMATNGAPESAEAAISLMRAVRELALPTLVIDHVAKAAASGDKPRTAFGSVYTTNVARLAWSVTSTAAAGELRLRASNVKANNGPRSAPVSVVFTFSGQRVLISVGSATTGSLIDQLVEALDEPRSLADLSSRIGASRDTVRKAVTRHPEVFAQLGDFDLYQLLPEAF